MAQGLILYDGALLLVNGGLTVDPNCCCDPPPPEPCPPCCVRIDFGTFDSDGNLFGEFAESGHTIEVLITMPTKFSRIICDEQEITVRWSYFDSEDNPADADGGFVRFGNGWIGGAGSPAIAGDGIFLVRGLIDWGVSASATFYEAGFTFRECFMDSSFFLYYLDIGLTSPEWSETIEISRCPSPELCCPESVECADCCALLVQNDAVRFEGKYIFYDESFNAGGGRKTMIIETQLNNGRACIGEAFTINVYLIPARHEPLDAGSRLTCNHPTWIRNQFSPAIGGDGVLAAASIQWGLLTDYEYEIVLEALDCDDCDVLPLTIFSDIVFISDLYGSASMSFTKCDLSDCCTIIKCCPDPLPRRLFATITDFGNCACGDGVVIAMRYSDAQGIWIGTGDFCGTPTTLRLYAVCDEFGIVFELSVDGACTIVRATSAHNCPPDFQTSNFFAAGQFDDCCGGVGTSVQVVIRGATSADPCD